MIEKVATSEIIVGKTFALGEYSLAEQEIINYAKEFDPLPFHVDKTSGEQSIFKGIIASGPHIFHKVHKREWIPRFGHTVICGLEVNNWKFLAPIYPDQLVKCQITVKEIKPTKKLNFVAINWFYEFLNTNEKPFQVLDMKVMHNME